jgi:hypothetical protein
MDPVTILSVGAGIGKLVYGGLQEIAGNRTAAENQRPFYNIPSEIYKNVGTYEELAQRGLPEDTLNQIHQKAVRSLSQSLSTGLQLGADANTVDDYYQSYLNNATDVATRDAMIRFNNINSLAESRRQLADQEFIQFGYNKDAPYKDKAQLAAQEKTQGINNIFGGIDLAASGIANEESRKLYTDRTNAIDKSAYSHSPSTFDVSGTSIGSVEPKVTTPTTVTDSPWMSRIRVAQSSMAKGLGVGEDYYWNKLANGWHFQTQ